MWPCAVGSTQGQHAFSRRPCGCLCRPAIRRPPPSRYPLSPRAARTALNRTTTPEITAAMPPGVLSPYLHPPCPSMTFTDHTTTHETTPPGRHLYEATRRGDVASLRALLRTGADVDFAGGCFHNTPLMTSAAFGAVNAYVLQTRLQTPLMLWVRASVEGHARSCTAACASPPLLVHQPRSLREATAWPQPTSTSTPAKCLAQTARVRSSLARAVAALSLPAGLPSTQRTSSARPRCTTRREGGI